MKKIKATSTGQTPLRIRSDIHVIWYPYDQCRLEEGAAEDTQYSQTQYFPFFNYSLNFAKYSQKQIRNWRDKNCLKIFSQISYPF